MDTCLPCYPKIVDSFKDLGPVQRFQYPQQWDSPKKNSLFTVKIDAGRIAKCRVLGFGCGN